MKKKILPLLLSLAMLTGCSSLVLEEPVERISIEKAVEMYDNDETFGLLVMESKDSLYNRVLNNLDKVLAKYDFVFYLVDLSESDTPEEQSLFEKLGTEEYMNLPGSYIPKFALVKDGETKASIDTVASFEWFEVNYPLIKDAD